MAAAGRIMGLVSQRRVALGLDLETVNAAILVIEILVITVPIQLAIL